MPIHHVSDTALWVAHYRAIESARTDALFHDRLAKTLVGDRGRQIAQSMGNSSPYTQWSVIVRTWVIDGLIQNLVERGVDTVINLGAGLDTRPYRLKLPPALRWIEVDYETIVEHKNRLLAAEMPAVDLSRVSLDLADLDKRRALFRKLAAETKHALILTEGVLPYLTQQQVASLAEDLRAESNFRSWIAEYYSTRIYRYLRTRKRAKLMKNAPFQFFPADWFEFFRAGGWVPSEIKYIGEEAMRIGRMPPFPWWVKLLHLLMGKERLARSLRQMGYVVYTKERNPTPEAAA